LRIARRRIRDKIPEKQVKSQGKEGNKTRKRRGKENAESQSRREKDGKRNRGNILPTLKAIPNLIRENA